MDSLSNVIASVACLNCQRPIIFAGHQSVEDLPIVYQQNRHPKVFVDDTAGIDDVAN